MTPKDRIRSPTKFYQEDIVQHVSSSEFGVILRCWYDAEEVQSDSLVDPMMRPLERGEVGVSFLPSGHRDILPESDFTLVDRNFQLGDYCKRSLDDVRSGVITSVDMQGRLEHVISGVPVEGWRSIDDLEGPVDASIGDYVLYDNYIGQVIELFDESVVEISNGQLVRLPELSSHLTVGEKGNDILPTYAGVQSLFGFLMGNHRPSNVDTVVAVKHTVLAICWLAINQSLDPSEAVSLKRPQRFWYGEDLSKLTMVWSKSEEDMRVGDKVLLRDCIGLPVTTHGQEGDLAGVISVQTFVVKGTKTTVNVLWQDGTQETLSSTGLIPYLNPDEYDCWPGDHVIWKSEGQQRTAIVQHVNASERTASVLFSDTGIIDLASLLELDPHGATDVSASGAHEGLGVRRGDFVFIHPEGTTNGLEKPRVPRIGEVEGWVREAPVQADGQLAGWRKEMSDIGTRIAAWRGVNSVEEGQIKRLAKDDSSLSWFGEVTGLQLDGTVAVTHPDSRTVIYPLERLTKLYDGIEQLEDDMWTDDMSDDHGSCSEEVWMDQDGVWQPTHDEDDGEWEETDDEGDTMDVDGPTYDPTQPNPLPIVLLPTSRTTSISTSTTSTTVPNAIVHSSRFSEDAEFSVAASSAVVRPPSPVSKSAGDEDSASDDSDCLPWKRFDILTSAPPDHTFYASSPSRPSKSFLGRLAKEYRILESSLPESILVRAYEDRTDLLRSLIIGPHNTPYEDAPFVIDWMLDSNFPQSPPIAHFLSWTNGNGRVNPNLYEDGKVCLSILGTWAGDRNETWSATRSSLLQTFVSIQGLVLVKEPWFCEPAYEKLRGTEEGIVNSRLYSEKAYVLSRGFVRRALQIPLGGLESEINWMYYTNGRLEKVVHDVQMLIQKSKMPIDQAEMDGGDDVAIPRLSGGGIITLDRTLTKLQGLLNPPLPHY